MKSKIMYIEQKTDGLRGKGRIGLVKYSKTGKTLYYGDKVLAPTAGTPLKANYYDQESHLDFWISGARKDGEDSLFSSEIEIDENVREEYWTKIRKSPEKITQKKYRSPGKTKSEIEKIEKGLRRRQMDNGWMPFKTDA